MPKYLFKDLIGNGYNKGLIQRTLMNGTFPGFTILEGVYGTGKSTIARIAAMRLTCENPNGPEPCCSCATCKANMRAFETTGESPVVKVINLGIFENKTEFNDLIRDVFVLRSGSQANIYIFEEAHVLKNMRGAQTALLDEIDRIPKNTYIIMCTTKGQYVIKELKSRAITYKFNVLSTDESYALLEATVGDKLPFPIKSLLVRYSKGIPRLLLNSLDFVMQNNISEEEYREFVQDVSDDSLAYLFEAMKSPTISSFVAMTDSLIESRAVSDIQHAMKEFLMNMLFYKEGATTVTVVESAISVFENIDSSIFNKLLNVIEQVPESADATDLRFALYKMRLIMQNRTLSAVYKEAPKIASLEQAAARTEAKGQVNTNNGSLSPINLNKIERF